MYRPRSSPSRRHSRTPPRRSRSPHHSSSSPSRRESSPTHRGSSSRRNSSEARETESRVDYKAAFLALQASNELQSQKKRKRSEAADKTGSTQAMGRGIRMLAMLFGEISTVIADAETYLLDPCEEVNYDEFTAGLTEEQQAFLAVKRAGERNVGAYFQIKRLVPGLDHKLSSSKPEDLVNFYAALQKGANDSRSDDISRLSRLFSAWVNVDRDHSDIAILDHTPPIVDERGVSIRQYSPFLTDERTNRGIGHDICGGLMSTVEHDWSSEDVRTQLREGDLDLNESFYCRIFYLDFQGNGADVNEGFLRSRYLVRGYKAVFTGPASAKEDTENTRPAQKLKTLTKPVRKLVCEIMRMDGKVTPRSIAYVAVIMHFVLTNAQSWTPHYYGFSYPQMYNFIVDYFEAPLQGTPQHVHVDALLAWWNRQIFPTHASSSATSRTAVNSFAKLQAQISRS